MARYPESLVEKLRTLASELVAAQSDAEETEAVRAICATIETYKATSDQAGY